MNILGCLTDVEQPIFLQMKKRIILFIVGFFLMLELSYLFFSEQNSSRKQQNNVYKLTQEEKRLLQEGDIIFRRGFGVISDAIVKYVPSSYPVSHCGIIVKDSLEKWMVIHTVSNTLTAVDGMQQDNLDKFVKESHEKSIIVARYKYKNDSLAIEMASLAKNYLAQQIPFDHRFDCVDSTAFFCTEFIYRVLKNAINVDVYNSFPEKKPDCMDFDVFLYPDNFLIILNHHIQRNL